MMVLQPFFPVIAAGIGGIVRALLPMLPVLENALRMIDGGRSAGTVFAPDMLAPDGEKMLKSYGEQLGKNAQAMIKLNDAQSEAARIAASYNKEVKKGHAAMTEAERAAKALAEEVKRAGENYAKTKVELEDLQPPNRLAHL